MHELGAFSQAGRRGFESRLPLQNPKSTQPAWQTVNWLLSPVPPPVPPTVGEGHLLEIADSREDVHRVSAVEDGQVHGTGRSAKQDTKPARRVVLLFRRQVGWNPGFFRHRLHVRGREGPIRE